ncbi:hypothetical protein T440DRAFT_556510 [Plenodomus tracheiphilus IPT5]|uniref:Uncharacterized protein n=1 Tax=Plenodomus tracheiphilus IPT5 TaxID=1408161 RepID=A0A6A7B1Z7_9PLEO|nr:hypothetical protein T440DRAFT_556510 [Plenodomus tracheiphilus IPT5]
MAYPFPKGQQPVRPHGNSHLRNEYHASSADEEIVHVLNSDIAVPETQFQDKGGFAGIDRDNDKQSDYGNEEGLEDAAVLERASVIKTTEVTAPSSPQWQPLTRESLRLVSEAAPIPSPRFTFGKPAKVAKRNTPQHASLELSQTSSRNLSTATGGRSSSAKDDQHTVAAIPDHGINQECGGLQHDDLLEQSSFIPTGTVNGDSAMRPMDHVFGGEQGPQLQGKQSTTPFAAQPKRLPSQPTSRICATKKGKKPRSGTHAQQLGGPWPPRGTVGSSVSYQTKEPTFPECFESDQSQDNHTHMSTGGRFEALPSSEEVRNDVLDTNAHEIGQSHEVDVQHNQVPGNGTTSTLRSNDLQSRASASPADATTALEQTSTEVVDGLPLCNPREMDGSILGNADALNIHPIDSSTCAQFVRSNSSTNDSKNPFDNRFVEQASLKISTESKATPRYNAQRSTNETFLHETTTQNAHHRVSKPQKKRVPQSTFTNRPQVLAGRSTIDSHIDALRVSLLAEQFRREHEQSLSTKSYEELVAALNRHIKLQDETIVDLKGKHEQLGSGVTRLTEKAKTNQKYVSGLQKDYEKIQKSVKAFQAQNQKTLREKIAEVEAERDALRKEFESTLDSFDTMKKNMMATIDDLYIRFQISESKRASHAESLRTQTAMLQEERIKRDTLEKSLIASVQIIQQHLAENTSALITKFEALQSQATAATAAEHHDSRINECLVAIRDLQSTPFLTIKDVQKAEGMLRFVHECVATGFESLSASGKSQDLIKEKTHEFIKAQMEILHRDILKYDEVVADNRTMVQANAVLKTRLETEQQHCCRLDAQLKALRQAEGDLRSQYIQLDCELRDLKNAACEKDHSPLITELELSHLHQQLKQASVDLTSANEKTQQAEKLRKEQEKISAEHETKCNALVDHLRKMEVATKQKPKVEDITKLREKIVDDCKRDFREKESGYKNEVHRLTLERDEKEQLLQKLRNELSASKDQLHDLRKDQQALNIKADALCKENEESRIELEELRQAASTSEASSSSIATLTDQLRQKTEELQSMTCDHARVQQQCADSTNIISELKASLDQLQSQVSTHSSAVESLRREAEDRLVESQKRANNAAELLLADASKLHMEKQEAASELERIRTRERDLEKREAELMLERDNLQRQLTERCAAGAEKDAEVLRVKADATKEKQMLVDRHSTELEAWTSRQVQTDAVLKEAEASLRRKDDECQAKIRYEREKAKNELSEVVEQYEASLQSRERPGPGHQPTSESLILSGDSTHSKLTLHVGLGRKKVDRQNNSKLHISNLLIDEYGQAVTVFRPDRSSVLRVSSDHSDNLFEEGTTARAPFSRGDLSQIHTAPDFVPDTQDAEGPTMSIDDFRDSHSRASRRELEQEKGSSTDLSPMNSDVLDHLGRDVEQQSGTTQADRSHENDKHAEEALIRFDNISEPGSRPSYSHERPKSQANTASRLMPPTAAMSKHFASRQYAEEGDDTSSMSQGYHKLDQASSPEYMPPPLRPTKKQTYGHRQSIRNRHEKESSDPLQDLGPRQGEKRKGLDIDRGTATKKPRDSSRFRAEGQSTRSSYSSKPSSEASRYRKRPDSSHTSINLSTVSHSQARNASSSVAPRTPTQHAHPKSIHRSREEQQPSSSTRSKATSRHSTRSKGRGYDRFDERFNRELS